MSGPGTRTVVVGAGMAATRLVEHLVARDAGPVTVLGDEPHEPYNRILLSAVLEGTHEESALALRASPWWADHGVDLRRDARVALLNRDPGRGGEVELVDGERLPYDRLVLATGSIPTLPPIRGLVRIDGRLDERVHAFRSLTDCRRLLAALPDARRVVVVGGGLLGLQVARALAVRGLDVEVVEGGEHLLHAQVGPAAGRVLARSLRTLGSAVYTGARAVRLTDEGLRLDNGYVLETDLVVLAAGGRPATSLARTAGLEVHRGVVVDHHLTTSDPSVHAIGDCAEHAGRTTGFVPPAWEQAQHLAEHLTALDHGDSATAYDGSRTVARLRATDLDVAVLGDEAAEVAAGGELVEVANPLAGSHRRLVVRDRRIVAATLVGDLTRVGLITQHFDRRTRLAPHEAGDLLMAPRVAGAADGRPPEHALPDTAQVCTCAGVTAGAIRACASVEDARETTRATTGCGSCAETVRQLLETRTPEGATA